jgi:ribosomal protein S18 acetylase RimI-like enzyme
MFKAEVLDGLKKKVPVLAEDSFAMLVVEECQINSSSSSSNSVFASAAAMPQSSRFAGGGSGNDSRDSIVCDRSTICDWNSADRLEDPVVMQPDGSTAAGINSTTCSYSTGRLVGVVEVALQDEAEVLQHLPLGVSNYAYISSMAVAADARRAGIGCTLLQAAEQQAALWQQALVSLHVYDTNVAALKLYEKHGMKVLATDSKLRRVLGGKVRHLMVKDVAACSGVSLEATPRAAAADG